MKPRIIIACLVISAVCAGVALAAEAGGIWIDVPFIPQTKDGCGSAAISMVMQYWAKQTGESPSPAAADPAKIQAALFDPAEKGIAASTMLKYFQDSGYRAFAFHGEWKDFRHQLSAGRPLIVSLRASGSRGPLHYVVAVGIDADREYVFVNDPAQQKMLRVSREGFEREWHATGNWMLLALPWPAD